MSSAGILMKLLRSATITKMQSSKTLERSGVVALGRWATASSESEKMRRIDLANLDSCGDEVCADPYLLIQNYKDAYYRGDCSYQNSK